VVVTREPGLQRYEFIRRAILTERSAWQEAGIVTLAVAVPTVLRWMMMPGTGTMPFVTYYPAVLLVAVVLDWRWAALVAALSALIANWLFLPEPMLGELTLQRLALVLFFALSCAVLVATGDALRRTVCSMERSAREREAQGRELYHRVQNVLAVVQALARTGDSSHGIEAFREELSGRVVALAAANRHLWDADLHSRPLRALVKLALEPFAAPERFTITGGEQVLTPAQGQQLLLILHELGTNALKHGALRSTTGRVAVRWPEAGPEAGLEAGPEAGPEAGEDGAALEIEWIESGGPPVSPPTRRGLGTRLMTGQAALAVTLDFAESGLRCTIRAN